MWGDVIRRCADLCTDMLKGDATETKSPAQQAMKRCFWAGLRAVLLDGYINPSSAARLTAERRLLTSSFL